MRVSILIVGVALASLVAVAPSRAVEQTIEPLSPGVEQRVQVLGGDEQVEAVEGADAQRIETVEPKEPPGPVVKTATTVGKVVVGVMAAGLGIGTMVASLLFF